MVRLILNIILFILLAVFVAINMPYTTTINLYGFVMEDISTVAVILITLAIGIVYSFITYFVNFLVKKRREKIKKTRQQAQEKEKQLKIKEKDFEAAQKQSAEAAAESKSKK
jgi:F0F1-type ATP synthase membrane subunit b/b'